MDEKRSVSKLGIYVPEYRLADVEKWRSKMNFSEIFWKAFDREVAIHSIRSVKGTEMQRLVDRLKSEGSKDQAKGEKEGAAFGKAWAIKYASHRHIRQIAEQGLIDGYENQQDFLVKEYERAYDERDFDRSMEECEVSDEEAFSQGFDKGFEEAVSEIWNQLKKAR